MIKVRIPQRFRIPVLLLRQAPGAYVNGLFVDGFEEQFTINVSWQAIQPSEYRLLPEGNSPIGVFQVYWDQPFFYGRDGGEKTDRIEKGSIRYKLLKPNDWIDGGFVDGLFQEIKQ